MSLPVANARAETALVSAAAVEAPALTHERRAVLGRRAQIVAGASVAYNVVEAIVAITAGAPPIPKNRVTGSR